MQGIKRANLADPSVRKRFVTYKEAAELYSMGLTRVQEHAKSAGATYKMGNKVLVNVDIFEAYLEQFRIPGECESMASADYDKVKQYAAEHHQTISQVVLEGLSLLYNREDKQSE